MTAFLQAALPFVLAIVCLGVPSALLAGSLLGRSAPTPDDADDRKEPTK